MTSNWKLTYHPTLQIWNGIGISIGIHETIWVGLYQVYNDPVM